MEATQQDAFAAEDALTALCHQCQISSSDLAYSVEGLRYSEDSQSWLDDEFRKTAKCELEKLSTLYSDSTTKFVQNRGLQLALENADADKLLPGIGELPFKVSAETNAAAVPLLAVKLMAFTRTTIRNLAIWKAMIAEGDDSRVSSQFRRTKTAFRMFHAIDWDSLLDAIESEFKGARRYCTRIATQKDPTSTDNVKLPHSKGDYRALIAYDIHLDPSLRWRQVADKVNERMRKENRNNGNAQKFNGKSCEVAVRRLVKNNPEKYRLVGRETNGRPRKDEE
ncbi:hypothetical protein GYB59_06270 [bacterium]|nr:hypothetical protein [bacterium]